MPEGPEIRRAADAVSVAILGKVARQVQFGLEPLKRFEADLSGQTVSSVSTRGKAMLIGFDNGLTLFSHNQLYGRWYTLPAFQYPDSERQLRIAIHTSDMSALLYSASDIQVLDPGALQQHPFLAKLGPDVLAASTSADEVWQRLTAKPFVNRRLGAVLTDQAFVAGLGNYLRSEVLFLAGLDPELKPKECSREELARLAEAIIALPRQSYATGGITADLPRAEFLMKNGASFERARFNLFRREGLPCYRCAARIQQRKIGGQQIYVCPQCQRSADT
ncbi:MAG: endonuclease VIII [Gammaproteobacteria bacterium]|nr:endonuclease VIII [Gammaproteobacteria bacterium]MCB1873204.1 endonuclease VIII [Gammaproteobacteria bacterium]MCB1881279.1 endonuclease VIII [Gammaproteobacteria bacterium]MCB1903819.1 endonuclease VIII [Gammaproteobacteria bacterium]MCP5427743.1 endonuclease VIII [Chromatiaceae bacterium]